MELNEENVLSATTKERTLAFLCSASEFTTFEPGSSCGCMYHDLMCVQFGLSADEVSVDFFDIEACGEHFLIMGTYAERYQERAIAYLYEREGLDKDAGVGGYRNRAISRNEAIMLAEEVQA